MKEKYFKIRDFNGQTDRAYVIDSYLRALRKCDGYDSLSTDVFYEQYRGVAEMASDFFTCKVAYLCGEDDDEIDESYIFGFVQYRKLDENSCLLGYCYTRELYRNTRVFRSLLESICGDVSESTFFVMFGNNQYFESLSDKQAGTVRMSPESALLCEDKPLFKVLEAAKKSSERKKSIYKERKLARAQAEEGSEI